MSRTSWSGVRPTRWWRPVMHRCRRSDCSPTRRSRRKAHVEAPSAPDRDLFDVLRDVRLRLARERGVPPYVIFHDTTLRDMVQRRPRTLGDLHDGYGVGVKKAA